MKGSYSKLDTGALGAEIDKLKGEVNVKQGSGEAMQTRNGNEGSAEKTDKSDKQNDGQIGKRRKHKNSKNGCPNCKKRRVKCSEDLPACTNCVRRKVRCGYLDYNEEQLKDLRQSKFVVENANNYNAEQPKKLAPVKGDEVQQPSPSSLNTLGTTSLYSLGQEADYNLSGDALINNEFGWNEQLMHGCDSGVNNVLNFEGNLVTTDGDNLLASAEYPIVYPVYSIKDTNMLQGGPSNVTKKSDPNPSFRPSRDVFNSGAFGPRQSSPLNESYVSPLSSDYNEDQVESYNKTSKKSLPGAIESDITFKRIIMPNIDYGQLIYDLMMKFGPQLASGTCSLEDNVYLYSIWLHSFIYYSFTEKLMFGSMVNFTTNYLISCCWLPEFISKDFTALIDRTKVRNLLISSSIGHYAMAIKELRRILNKDSNPLLCSSGSFVLSLTSIYDPSATVRTMNCFRDGLFSILQHNVTNVTKKGESLPFMLMMHLEILKNIVRSVYLPAYDPGLLYEYRSMLTTYGNIIRMLNASSNNDPNTKEMYAHRLIDKKFNDLLVFTNDIINSYLPTINNNLDQLDLQEQALFEMLHKWVRIFPAKAISISIENDPVENVLFFFYKALKKVLYAVFPQVKYFYVREFDSPVTVDIHVSEDDFELFQRGLEYSETCSYLQHAYEQVKNELKILCSYSIRLIIFLQKRLEILNRTVIYDWVVKEAFPIDDIKKFRAGVSDIAEIREDFSMKVQLTEVPITSFTTTLIKPHHYPRRFNADYSSVNNQFKDHVDLLTLTSNGLLANDYKEQ